VDNDEEKFGLLKFDCIDRIQAMNEQESEQAEVPSPPLIKQTKWPKTIGIIAMVFGVLGALNGLIAMISSFFSEFLAKMSQLPPDFYDKWRPFMLGSGAGTVFLGVLLFSGGLFLTMRKRISSRILNSWALLKMVLGMVSVYYSFQMQQEQMPLILEQQKKTMEKAGGGAGAEQMVDMMTGFTEIATMVGMVLGLVWLMVLPVFILIWFIRPDISEEVAEWGKRVES